MMAANQLKINNFQNIGEIFIPEHFFDIILALWKFNSLQFSYLIVIDLQIWKF